MARQWPNVRGVPNPLGLPDFLQRHGRGPAAAREARFALRMESVNVDGLGPLKARLENSTSHVLVAQETKIKPRAVDEAVEWARRHGWKMLAEPGSVSEDGGVSGGVAICVRADLGLCDLAGAERRVWPGRVLAAQVEAPGYRPMAVYAVYLIASVGMDEANLGIRSGACSSRGPARGPGT